MKPTRKEESKMADEKNAKREPKFADNARVTVLVDNPKKGKSKDRFALYGKKGTTKTVGELVKAGMKRADFSWDLKREFIRIEPTK